MFQQGLPDEPDVGVGTTSDGIIGNIREEDSTVSDD